VSFDVVALALAAACFTALASVAQRRAAAPAPEELTLSWRLVGYLLRRPVWFMGIASMILGFVFQVDALRVGSLSVVQPVIATELVIVFGVIALKDRNRVHGRDWLAAAGMVIGLGTFLALAHPHGGQAHATASHWVVAGVSTLALTALIAAVAYLPGRGGRRASSSRKAALLGIAAASGFGFVAAVVKELSSHLHEGFSGVFLSWSPYVLLLSGALSMFLASHAFQAGSLAASQPGLTIVDPLVASTLGVVLFGDRLDLRPDLLLGEVCAIVLIAISAIVLSRSPLMREGEERSGPPDPESRPDASRRVDLVRSWGERTPDRRRRLSGALWSTEGLVPPG
jgi:hypothetical protein